ncbi:MAG TPA: ABC transporter permease [Vicinamibacterales bacterium]|nr:ABC transporter permease [Vicinamibacterales bacterium]
MTSVVSDLKHGVRVLFRTPLFTICTIAALAIGIGSTTALFSVVYALLMKPLPYGDADSLVVMWEHHLARNRPRNVVSPANFLAWRERSQSFDSMAAFTQNRVTLTGSGEPQELATIIATANIFDVLGVAPALGRPFAAGEDQDGAPRTVALSHALWQRQFGGDPTVVGRDVSINGEPVTVIAVMPRTFEIFGLPADVYLPFRMTPATSRPTGRSLVGIGRLKPGVTRDQAQAEMEGVMAALTREWSDFNTGWTINLVPLREQLVGDVRLAVLVLFGAVGAVLLIACANIGSLMLTRASARRRELAIRSAIGAGTGRLLTQLICESLLLSIAGGVAGVLLAAWLLDGLATWLGSRLPLPLLSQVTVDPAVLAFAAIATMLTTTLCGLAPAIGATGGSLIGALREGAQHLSASRRGSLLRQGLVMAEIALALTVLCGAGLLGRSLMQLQRVDPGFTPDSALSLRVTLPQRTYGNSDLQHGFYTRVINGLRALPQVTHVGGTSFLPLAGVGPATSFWRADAPQPAPNERPVADARPVTPGYFAAMNIPLLAGRDVNDGDTADKDPVAVINETFARQIYPSDNPLGRKFILNLGNTKPHEIIGVVGDVRLATLEGDIRPTVYLSSRQYAFGLMNFVVRTTGDPARLGPSAVRIIREIDPLLPVSAVRPLDDVFAESIARPRLTAVAMSIFGGAALLLAALGVYGIVAYSVSQRSREFGIRVALGAKPSQIIRMVVGQNLRIVALGLALGLLAAVPATRLLRGLLYQVGPNDPTTFVAIGVMLTAVAIVAAYLPARRGTQIDPVVTLKSE